jgi:hypothetical protein
MINKQNTSEDIQQLVLDVWHNINGDIPAVVHGSVCHCTESGCPAENQYLTVFTIDGAYMKRFAAFAKYMERLWGAETEWSFENGESFATVPKRILKVAGVQPKRAVHLAIVRNFSANDDDLDTMKQQRSKVAELALASFVQKHEAA